MGFGNEGCRIDSVWRGTAKLEGKGKKALCGVVGNSFGCPGPWWEVGVC